MTTVLEAHQHHASPMKEDVTSFEITYLWLFGTEGGHVMGPWRCLFGACCLGRLLGRAGMSSTWSLRRCLVEDMGQGGGGEKRWRAEKTVDTVRSRYR